MSLTESRSCNLDTALRNLPPLLVTHPLVPYFTFGYFLPRTCRYTRESSHDDSCCFRHTVQLFSSRGESSWLPSSIPISPPSPLLLHEISLKFTYHMYNRTKLRQKERRKPRERAQDARRTRRTRRTRRAKVGVPRRGTPSFVLGKKSRRTRGDLVGSVSEVRETQADGRRRLDRPGRIPG